MTRTIGAYATTCVVLEASVWAAASFVASSLASNRLAWASPELASLAVWAGVSMASRKAAWAELLN
jgi:hypothetical protein